MRLSGDLVPDSEPNPNLQEFVAHHPPLFEEGEGPIPIVEVIPNLEGDCFLKALLNESVRYAKERTSVQKARKILATPGLVKDKQKLIEAVRSWEVRREWNVRAWAIAFLRQKCENCGAFHTQFSGYYQRQEHRASNINRWVSCSRPENGDNEFPRESKYEDSIVPLCHSCAIDFDWQLEEE